MTLHPRNTQFSWDQPNPPFEVITEAQAQSYRELGGFILEDAFDDTLIAQVLDALDPIEAEVNERLQHQPKDQPSIARADEIAELSARKVFPRLSIWGLALSR